MSDGLKWLRIFRHRRYPKREDNLNEDTPQGDRGFHSQEVEDDPIVFSPTEIHRRAHIPYEWCVAQGASRNRRPVSGLRRELSG
jgi:hypothetical protein